MDSSRLRPDQLRGLRARLAPELSYLARLLERMQSLGFASDDDVYRATHQALLTMEELDRAAINTLARHGVVKEADDYPPDLVRRA
jgi:hypothetical protein